MIKNIFIPLLALPLLLSCSSDEVTQEVITGSYSYMDDMSTHNLYVYENENNYIHIQNALQKCNTVEYTIGETTTEEKTFKKDLCENTEHEYCTDISLSFYGNKCTYKERKYKVIQNVTKTTETTKYIFKEGSFIASEGGAYYGGHVYSYGLYRAEPYSSSYVLILPFHSDFTYNVSYINYTSDLDVEDIENIEETLNYTVDGDVIYLSNENTSLKAIRASNGIILEKDGASYVLEDYAMFAPQY